MLYLDFKVNETDYKLRLNTRAIVALEKNLGKNPLSIFVEAEKGNLPQITEMVTILHAALQPYHNNINLNKTYDLFDEWLAAGNIASDFISVILELYKLAGLIKNEKNV